MYYYNYQKERCAEKSCDSCAVKSECILYTPEPDWPWESRSQEEEEYRIYVPRIDDTTEELIQNMSRLYSQRWGLPYKEAYKLLSLAWCQGWRLKELLQLAPWELERCIAIVIVEDFRSLISEMIEHGEIDEINEIDIGDLILDSIATEYIIMKRNMNFTGEVRLLPSETPSEEVNKEVEEKEVPSIWKFLKEIVTIKSGHEAFSRSEEVKKYIKKFPRIRRFLREAWEARRRFASLSPEERLKKVREEYGWLF